MAYLRLNISNLCNFSCKYCHVFNITENNAPLRIMDYETISFSIENFIDILKKYNENNLTLSIYGGEPLINKKNLFLAIEKYRNNYQNVNINWMVNTNGSLLNDEVADFFKEHDIDVHLSADGLAEIHNKNRVDKFGKGTFDRVEKSLCLIRDKGLKAQLNSFIFPENANNLFDLVGLARNFNINRIYLDLFYDTQNRMLNSKTISNKYAEVYKYGLGNKVNISGPWSYTFMDYVKVSYQRHKTPPTNVTVDGKFFFNRSPTMDPLGLDLLNYEDFKENYLKVQQSFKKLVDDNCKYCFLRKSCAGGMISQFQYHTKLDKGWKSCCEASKEIIKLVKEIRRG